LNKQTWQGSAEADRPIRRGTVQYSSRPIRLIIHYIIMQSTTKG